MKTADILSAACLGLAFAAGIAGADELPADSLKGRHDRALTAGVPELIPADKGVVSVLRAYNACVGGKMGSVVDAEGALDPEKIPADLLQNLLGKIRATIAELKAKDPDMPEVVINLVTGMEAAGIVQRWAKDGCDEELKPDWPAIKARLKDMQEQHETPYGREFFRALNGPRPAPQ